MSDISWQLIVALACVAIASASLLLRLARFLGFFVANKNSASCGACGGCATPSRAAADQVPPTFVPLEALRAGRRRS